MLDSIKTIETWDFKGTAYNPVHTFHPYFAKYHPDLPKNVILSLTQEGDIILDPFSGSGTTLVEASLMGRSAIGIDANPIACLMAKVKTTPISDKNLNKAKDILLSIENDIFSYYGEKTLFNKIGKVINYKIPDFHNRDSWFTKNSLNELAIIKAHIEKIKNNDLKDLLKLSFSRIIVFASNQETESKYRRVDKKRKPKDVLEQFKKTVISMLNSINEYGLERKKFPDIKTKIYNKDSRNIKFVKPATIDLIVTSPPYLNSWDYGLYHRFRFFWLDMDVHDYEDKEIGKHLRALEGRSKNDEVERYRIDMGLCLSQFSKVLKKGKFCCIVNANSIVQKKFIDTNKILIEEGKKNNLKIEEIIDKKVYGPHYGMHASLNSKKISVEAEKFTDGNGEIEKTEQLLFFKKV